MTPTNRGSNFSDYAIKVFSENYSYKDMRTWPYFPIAMPLKDGLGPAPENDCDEITWEVWDHLCETHGSFKCLADAINKSIELNEEFLKENNVS